jgi:hypothetical protein
MARLVFVDASYVNVFYEHRGSLRAVLSGCINRLGPQHSFVATYGKDEDGVGFFEITLLQYRQGGKVIQQSGIVKLLGSVDGLYTVELEMHTPIHPVASTLDDVLNVVESWKITPVNRGAVLTTRPLRGGFVDEENIMTDGVVELCDGDLWASSDRRRVRGATWAVVHNGRGGIADVYVWGNISPDGKDNLLSAIKKAQS